MLAPLKQPACDDDTVIERWHLALPPEAVVGLLRATCIDRTVDRQTATVVWNTLWGPKSWTIRFEGFSFRLEPLQRNSKDITGEAPYEWLGTIAPTKFGSVVELRVGKSGTFLAFSNWDRKLVRAIAAAAAIVSVPFAAQWGSVAMVAIPLIVFAWGLIASFWMGIHQASVESFAFLDQVFAQYLVSKT